MNLTQKTQISNMITHTQISSTNPLQPLDLISNIPTPLIQLINSNRFETLNYTKSSCPDIRLLHCLKNQQPILPSSHLTTQKKKS